MSIENLFNNKIDAYLVTSGANCFYFSKFNCSNACVILTPDTKYFITDFRYEYAAQQALPDFEVVITSKYEKLDEAVRILKKHKVKNVGIEDNVLYSEYKSLKSTLTDFSVKNISSALSLLRAIKSPDEIIVITEALKIAENALLKASKLIKVGVTERELSAEIMYEMLLNGADKDAFTSIVASGVNASMPHCSVTDRKFEKGDFIMIDIGAQCRGYCSDITRTLPLGVPSKQLQKIYTDVLNAQCYALKNIKAGITAHEADSFAREYLLSCGYSKEFGHSLGHGVGIDIHELPSLSPQSDTVLQENMVITVEPGVYLRDVGGVRIEDLAVVTKDGVCNLTNYPKELII